MGGIILVEESRMGGNRTWVGSICDRKPIAYGWNRCVCVCARARVRGVCRDIEERALQWRRPSAGGADAALIAAAGPPAAAAATDAFAPAPGPGMARPNFTRLRHRLPPPQHVSSCLGVGADCRRRAAAAAAAAAFNRDGDRGARSRRLLAAHPSLSESVRVCPPPPHPTAMATAAVAFGDCLQLIRNTMQRARRLG
jgi:hypothetical protein